MELLILAFACKAACARRVILVVPYLPYCKQNKMRKRGSITCKLIAQLICSTGIDHVITIDLHSKEIQVWTVFPVVHYNFRVSSMFLLIICALLHFWFVISWKQLRITETALSLPKIQIVLPELPVMLSVFVSRWLSFMVLIARKLSKLMVVHHPLPRKETSSKLSAFTIRHF